MDGETGGEMQLVKPAKKPGESVSRNWRQQGLKWWERPPISTSAFRVQVLAFQSHVNTLIVFPLHGRYACVLHDTIAGFYKALSAVMPPPLDPTVASAIDTSLRPTTSATPPSDDEDELLSALDADSSIPQAYRAARLQELSTEYSRLKTLRAESHGTITTLTSEAPLMEAVTSSPLALIHFFHPDFATCKTMDTYLEKLAGLHYEVRFLRIDAREAPFLVTKLGVRVLPCVVGYKGGVEKGRIVGFEGVGGISGLEDVLLANDVFVRAKWREEKDGGSKQERVKAIRQRQKDEEEEDDDWD